jgi:metal transporter CNNM
MFGVGHGDAVICGSTDAILTSAIQHYEAEQALDTKERLIYASVSFLLILIAGICAGLTLGLLSMSPLDLELIKRTAVSNKQKQMALKVERVTRNPHQLLVCLLVVNAGCMEMLPLLLDRLLNPLAAILISVSAILIFGEVVPQAVCKKYGLQIGASLAWLVHIMLFITWPVSYPIGKLLDWSLGGSHGKAFFRRAELKEFVTLHGEAPEEEGATESVLTTEECQVIHGALDMAHKTAETAMTPLDKVFQISADAPFDRVLLKQIIEAGHSRVPVYESDSNRNIIGLILVKELLMHEPNGSLLIKECNIREIDFLVADTPLYSVMQLFQMKRRHMAVVIQGGDGGGGGGGGGGRDIYDSGLDLVHSARLGSIDEVEEESFKNNDSAFVVGSSGSLEEALSGGNGHGGVGGGSAGEVVGIITAEDVLEVSDYF